MAQEIQEDSKGKEEMLNIPKFISLDEKYKCSACKLYKRNICRAVVRSPYIACDCPKRFGILKIFANMLAIATIYYVFKKTLYMFHWPLLSFFLAVVTTCILDLLFIGFGNVIRRFFLKLEKQRYNRYEARVNEIEKQREEEAKLEEQTRKKEEAKFAEVNAAREVAKQFYDISQTEDKQESANPFKSKAYKDFLKILNQISDMIVPESFAYLDIKHLFQIHLPEFFDICKNYLEHYEDDGLLGNEQENFNKLLDSFTARLLRTREDLKGGKNASLNIRMQALTSLISTKEREQ